MKKDTASIKKKFLDMTGMLTKQWGLGEPAGRIWATLVFADTPLSQRDIATNTSYSPSLISPSLKILEKLNIIRSTRGRSRERVYESTASLTEFHHLLIKQFLLHEIKPLIAELDQYEDIKRNPQLSKLIFEYKQLERYLSWFEKSMSARSTTKKNYLGDAFLGYSFHEKLK